MIRQLILGISAATLVSTPAFAHNVWLLPSSTVLAKADTITVDAAVSNDLFFFNYRPLALDNLKITGPDGSLLSPENLHNGKLRSVFDLTLSKPGTYRMEVINQGVFANYVLNGEKKRWRGTAAELGKAIPSEATQVEITESIGRIETYATLGKPTPVRDVRDGLAIQAKTHPNDLVKGETAQFILTIDGKPASNTEVSVTPGGTRYRNQLKEVTVKTDTNGVFSIQWPSAGLYWLEATSKDQKTTVTAAKERRLSYALTVEVLPD